MAGHSEGCKEARRGAKRFTEDSYASGDSHLISTWCAAGGSFGYGRPTVTGLKLSPNRGNSLQQRLWKGSRHPQNHTVTWLGSWLGEEGGGCAGLGCVSKFTLRLPDSNLLACRCHSLQGVRQGVTDTQSYKALVSNRQQELMPESAWSKKSSRDRGRKRER